MVSKKLNKIKEELKKQEFPLKLFGSEKKDNPHEEKKEKWKKFENELPTEEEIIKKRKEKHEINKKIMISADKKVIRKKDYIKTGIPGFDELFRNGIPKGASVLIAGGPGSGKTIACLQILANAVKKGKKCLYISFEESEEKLKEHMSDFGWDWETPEKKRLLIIRRFDPFRSAKVVEALLAEAKGELLIKTGIEDLIPRGFKPDVIVLDSISALASAFTEHGENYRIYIEQLFRFFEKTDSNSFLISETQEAPKKFSESGIEEFLADGVIVMYYLRRGNIRQRALEVFKMRGATHDKKIVAMEINDKGLIVYTEQDVFGGI